MSKQITQEEIEKYWEIFCTLSGGGTHLSGDQAARVLKNSNLRDDQLSTVWDLADIDTDGSLDFEEFCVAMRLTFDLVNGVYKELPGRLPVYLVPESKAHLVDANQALNNTAPQIERALELDDDTPGLKDGFDWYMSPSDKDGYDKIYSANADGHGQLSYYALEDLYASLDVPDTEIQKAWKLVNPKNGPTIGKDQAFAFLHVLNNRHEGYRIKWTVPASLRATFEKNQIDYNVSNVRSLRARDNDDGAPTFSSKKEAFGQSYLTRLGIGGRGGYTPSGTDFSSSKDQDWEEVRLKRQLADLEKKIEETEAAAASRRDRSKHGATGASKQTLVKRELEQMLEYKRLHLRELDDATRENRKTGGASLSSLREDLDMVRQQVDALEGHLRSREEVLTTLKAEIEQEKASR
ncbi:actin cytoskeleton-regulatory complex protein END3-domain-containing protein [Tirmania nivea]|nr:actin cytoskeleton-regulatory complex protein END3-domain-containing protein [Tirmania nivea]